MQHKIKAWLYDMLNAIHEIESFIDISNYSFELYAEDLKTKRAVERNIEIIGEAMNRVLSVDENINVSDARKIVDLRNRIIHGYDSVSDEMIFSIILTSLPKLKGEIEKLLDE